MMKPSTKTRQEIPLKKGLLVLLTFFASFSFYLTSNSIHDGEEVVLTFHGGGVEVVNPSDEKDLDFNLVTNPVKSAICKMETVSGTFENGKFIFNGPCQEAGLLKWYKTREEACEILKKFDIFIIGQSTERRLVHTLVEMVSGNEEAFLNDFSDPSKNDLFDEKGDIDDKVLKSRGFPEFARECLNLKFFTGQFAGHSLMKAKDFIKSSKLLQGNGRKKIVMFQFGLYSAAVKKLVTAEGVRNEARSLVRVLRRLRLQERSAALKAGNITVVWHPPPPVNRNHNRFRQYRGEVNKRLKEFRDLSVAISQSSNVEVFDIFDVLLHGTDSGLIDFETGKEWTPPQHGGIHVKNSGRRVVAQIFLNGLSVLNQLGHA